MEYAEIEREESEDQREKSDPCCDHTRSSPWGRGLVAACGLWMTAAATMLIRHRPEEL
jgi:hypothetical protein